jgi:hypothetical protein
MRPPNAKNAPNQWRNGLRTAGGALDALSTMRLLILLSALLTALTGFGPTASVSAAPARHVVAVAAIKDVAGVTRVMPAHVQFAGQDSEAIAAHVAPAPLRVHPIYAERLRV